MLAGSERVAAEVQLAHKTPVMLVKADSVNFPKHSLENFSVKAKARTRTCLEVQREGAAAEIP